MPFTRRCALGWPSTAAACLKAWGGATIPSLFFARLASNAIRRASRAVVCCMLRARLIEGPQDSCWASSTWKVRLRLESIFSRAQHIYIFRERLHSALELQSTAPSSTLESPKMLRTITVVHLLLPKAPTSETLGSHFRRALSRKGIELASCAKVTNKRRELIPSEASRAKRITLAISGRPR